MKELPPCIVLSNLRYLVQVMFKELRVITLKVLVGKELNVVIVPVKSMSSHWLKAYS